MLAMPRSDDMADPSDEADSADTYNYDLQLGDVYVAVYNGEETEEDLYMSLYVSTVAPMSLAATGDGTGLTLDIGEPTVKVDVVATSPDYAVSTEATESLFADLMTSKSKKGPMRICCRKNCCIVAKIVVVFVAEIVVSFVERIVIC